MPDYSKILTVIATSTDAGQLRNFQANAQAKGVTVIAQAAFNRLLAILVDHPPGSLEADFWTMIHAFEEVLRIERGKTVRLTRTRQKVAKVGEIQTLIDFATAASPTEGFDALLARGLPELTAEALVLKHAARFEPPVLAAAGARLAAAGVTLPSMQSEPA